MDLIFFITLIVVSFLLFIFSPYLPNPKMVAFVSGCIIILAGIIILLEGVSLSTTLIATTFVTVCGMMFAVFGTLIGVNSVLSRA